MPGYGELVELDDDELDNRLAEGRRELFNLRFQLATGQLDNVARITAVRRDIARALTEMRSREIRAAEAMEEGSLEASPMPVFHRERLLVMEAPETVSESPGDGEAGELPEGELPEGELPEGELPEGPGSEDPDE